MNQFMPGIHGLRALAALSVVLFHLVALSPIVALPAQLWFIPNYFGLGVQLFFVLSAFSLAHSTYPRMQKRDWVKIFAIKRFFRIAPLFYAAVLFFGIYNFVVWNKAVSPSEYIVNLLFVYGFIPGMHESIVWAGWTIGVEMIFYAMFPVCLAVLSTWRSAALAFLLSCLAAAAAANLLVQVPGLPRTYPSLSFVRGLPSFAAGLLAFHVYRLVLEARVPAKEVRTGCLAVVMVCATLLYSLPFRPVERPDLAVWGLLFAALCVWQAAAPGAIIASRPLQFIGERSYSVYLVHALLIYNLTPAYELIHALLPGLPQVGFGLCVAVAVACVIGLASLTYLIVEAPFIRFGNRIIARRGSPDLARVGKTEATV